MNDWAYMHICNSLFTYSVMSHTKTNSRVKGVSREPTSTHDKHHIRVIMLFDRIQNEMDGEAHFVFYICVYFIISFLSGALWVEEKTKDKNEEGLERKRARVIWRRNWEEVKEGGEGEGGGGTGREYCDTAFVSLWMKKEGRRRGMGKERIQE